MYKEVLEQKYKKNNSNEEKPEWLFDTFECQFSF